MNKETFDGIMEGLEDAIAFADGQSEIEYHVHYPKKVIYHAQSERYDSEGMMLADGTIIGAWSGNDGNWRGEYFNGFMKELGIEVVNSTPEMDDILTEYFKLMWGDEEDE